MLWIGDIGMSLVVYRFRHGSWISCALVQINARAFTQVVRLEAVEVLCHCLFIFCFLVEFVIINCLCVRVVEAKWFSGIP